MKNIKKLFKNIKIFEQAMTHKSVLNEGEIRGKIYSNERLEFLGDAVLEFVVTDFIYKRFPEKVEGELTALRANIVSGSNLSKLAIKINLGEELKLGRGIEADHGRKNVSILENSVEALIGAIYVDRGMKVASQFIIENILDDIDEKLKRPLKDAKSRLQEIVQAKKMGVVKYNVLEVSGPPHNRKFKIEVIVDGKVWGSGQGKSKGEAQQRAAEVALGALPM